MIQNKECDNLPINITDLENLGNELQQQYEQNIVTTLQPNEQDALDTCTSNLQSIIKIANENFGTKISININAFKSIVERLYRLPDKTIGGNGELVPTSSEDIIELPQIPQNSTLSYAFSAILSLLLGICLIYVAYIILLQTPRELSNSNPLFKEIYDATIDNYTSNEVTLFAFIWNSITKISCSEHLDKIQNIFTTLITQTLESAMATTSEIARSTCIIPTNLVSGHYELFGRNVVDYINTAATSMTAAFNREQIQTCIYNSGIVAQQQLMDNVKIHNILLANSIITQSQLISKLFTAGVGFSCPAVLYLSYRISLKIQFFIKQYL